MKGSIYKQYRSEFQEISKYAYKHVGLLPLFWGIGMNGEFMKSIFSNWREKIPVKKCYVFNSEDCGFKVKPVNIMRHFFRSTGFSRNLSEIPDLLPYIPTNRRGFIETLHNS